MILFFISLGSGTGSTINIFSIIGHPKYSTATSAINSTIVLNETKPNRKDPTPHATNLGFRSIPLPELMVQRSPGILL